MKGTKLKLFYLVSELFEISQIISVIKKPPFWVALDKQTLINFIHKPPLKK